MADAEHRAELERLRSELQESRDRFQAFSEAAGEAIAFHEQGLIRDVNHAFATMFGYERGELLGRSVLDLAAPESREQVVAKMKSGNEESYEAWGLRKDGSLFVGRLLARNVRFRGQMCRVVVIRDITQQKRIEDDLRAEMRRFADIAENALEWIWEVDTAGRYTYASPVIERILGYAPAEVLGRHFYEFFHPHDREELMSTALAVFASGVPFRQFENRNVHKNGSEVWLSTSGVSIRDNDGKIIGYRGADTDITARKEAAAQQAKLQASVQQAQKMESLGLLAGGIAHDFNNLLMGVLGNAGLALMEIEASSPAWNRLKQIETTAQRAAELTNQLLAYSGKGQFVVGPLDVSELVEEMVDLLQTVVTKGVVLKCDLPRDLPSVHGDASQIRQVIMNLISNASDAISSHNGIVSVTTGLLVAGQEYLKGTYLQEDLPEGRYVFLEVSDTGCGIDAATKAQMFDPFFSTKMAGRGLGLAAVLGIVRGHRGALKVYSELGKGTTIKVMFPALGGREVTKAIQPLPAAGWHGTGLVLIVDDEEIVRHTARSILEKSGFTVITAVDGADAVHLFEQQADQVVAVLLDMTLPRMSGLETFIALRRLRPQVRVILSSGYNEQDATARFAGRGLAGFIQKPYSPQKLMEMLRGILERPT